MRLFVFAIGGTGARVLRSMVMQFSAGIVPTDGKGKPVENLTVVPIIIDPHEKNKAVQKANTLLVKYKNIHNEVYDKVASPKGYYAVKIRSLRDICTKPGEMSSYHLPNEFIYAMPDVTASDFKNFIGLNNPSLKREAKIFSKMLFSEEELNTKMSEGFYGSPNIGTIALNIFQTSDSYKAFVDVFKEGDRIIFIGSIFGGTGASGLPMLVTSFRNQNEKNPALPLAPMAATVIMPYFTIAPKENSEIKDEEFEIKTKSALKYYEKNLNPFLNEIYYIADELGTTPIENDSGEGGQTKNGAHFVEFIASLSIIDFAGKEFDNRMEITEMVENRREVIPAQRNSWQFTLKDGEERLSRMINFNSFDKKTNGIISVPMISFHIFSSFLKDKHFENSLRASYNKVIKLSSNAYTDDINEIIKDYREWLLEMESHGESAHNFIPFTRIDNPGKDFTDIVTEVNVKSKLLGKNKMELDGNEGIIGELNNKEKWYRNGQGSQTSVLIRIASDAIENVVRKKLELKNIVSDI